MKKYINSKKELKEFLKCESNNYNLKHSTYPLVAISENKVLYKCNYLLRKTEYYTNCKKRIRSILLKLLLLKYERHYNMYIPINVFNKGLKFIHIGARLVNDNAIVGENCIMHINTSIVAGGTTDDCPIIGNNVVIGIDAVISGKAIVGDNVAIGAKAFVNKDFGEGNMTIAGIPAKKISNNTRDSWRKENRK